MSPSVVTRRIATIAILCGFCAINSGCSVMMAARAPEKKNLSVLSPGASRSQVVAELGPPLQSRTDQYGEKDVFAFKQGYSLPTRVVRSTVHAAADVATVALWEVVGTPLESSLQGEDVRVEVAYDDSERVQRVEYFAGAHLANGGPTLASWMRRADLRQTAIVGNYPKSHDSHQSDVRHASGTKSREDVRHAHGNSEPDFER
jgi:hypothetical protein